MKLYDKKQIDWKNILFDNKTLFGLLLPIIVEQFLNSFMGMVDTMMVSVTSMWCCRVGLSVFLVNTFHFGLRAVWIGIFTDWIVRACIFSVRFISGKWLHEDMIM